MLKGKTGLIIVCSALFLLLMPALVNVAQAREADCMVTPEDLLKILGLQYVEVQIPNGKAAHAGWQIDIHKRGQAEPFETIKLGGVFGTDAVGLTNQHAWASFGTNVAWGKTDELVVMSGFSGSRTQYHLDLSEYGFSPEKGMMSTWNSQAEFRINEPIPVYQVFTGSEHRYKMDDIKNLVKWHDVIVTLSLVVED